MPQQVASDALTGTSITSDTGQVEPGCFRHPVYHAGSRVTMTDVRRQGPKAALTSWRPHIRSLSGLNVIKRQLLVVAKEFDQQEAFSRGPTPGHADRGR